MDSAITSLKQLRALYGEPKPTSINKQHYELTEAYRRWLDQSNFLVIASAGAENIDCTPRGDEPGQAFKVCDSNTIVIPDRRGNNRLDTLSNIVSNPKIALLFFIPGIEQVLRIMGDATITTSPDLLKQFELQNTYPVSCISVAIESVYFQNARALARSQLWQGVSPETIDNVPTPKEMMQSVSIEKGIL